MISRFRTHVVPPVCDYVRARGADVSAVLRRSGMPEHADRQPFVDVALATLHRFHEEAAAAVSDPLLGVHVGAAVRSDTWDVLQLAGRSAATLGEALQRLPRLLALFNRWVELSVAPGTEWRVTHRIPGEPLGMSRHGNELWMATLLAQLERATGRQIRPLSVWFAHPPHPQAREVAAALGVEAVQFGAGTTGLSLQAGDAAAKILTADPVLLNVVDRLAEQALAREAAPRGAAAQVYDELLRTLKHCVPSIGAVARSLAMSERSVQRALTAEGTSFRELIDQVRRELSARYAAEGRTVEDAADLLGYEDTASLSRARARWAAGDLGDTAKDTARRRSPSPKRR